MKKRLPIAVLVERLSTFKHSHFSSFRSAFYLSEILLICSSPAHAGIVASSTRLVYPQSKSEETVMLANTNDYPIIVQTWIDKGDADSTPEKAIAPFIPLPAVFKMQPGAAQSLRVINKNDAISAALPKDRESVFWLNIYEIPPINRQATQANAHVAMAMNTQMKIFYRPQSLTDDPMQALKTLKFSLIKQNNTYLLRCHNDTAFHASFGQITLTLDGKNYPLTQQMDMMTEPFSQRDYPFSSPISGALSISETKRRATVNYVLFDDEGNALVQHQSLQ